LTSDNKNISGNAYWDGVSEKISGYYLIPKLADYKNSEYIGLLERWDIGLNKRVLITDLYEAAYGNIGIYRHLSDISRELLATDISPKLCLKAKENLEENDIKLNVVAADARQIPLADRSVDLIISPSTFDHFPEIDRALSECFRILQPGGKLLLALNSADNPFFKPGVRLAERFKRHEYQTDHFYSAKQTSTLLERAGFSVGRHTAIMHLPIGATSLIELLSKPRNHISDAVCDLMIRGCRCWGRAGKGFKMLTGWWIVMEGIKINNAAE